MADAFRIIFIDEHGNEKTITHLPEDEEKTAIEWVGEFMFPCATCGTVVLSDFADDDGICDLCIEAEGDKDCEHPGKRGCGHCSGCLAWGDAEYDRRRDDELLKGIEGRKKD